MSYVTHTLKKKSTCYFFLQNFQKIYLFKFKKMFDNFKAGFNVFENFLSTLNLKTIHNMYITLYQGNAGLPWYLWWIPKTYEFINLPMRCFLFEKVSNDLKIFVKKSLGNVDQTSASQHIFQDWLGDWEKLVTWLRLAWLVFVA